MSITALFHIVLLGLLFGTTLVVSRFSVGQFDPVTYVGLRLSLASLGYLLFYLPQALGRPTGFRPPTGRLLWRRSALYGIVGTAIPMTSIVAALNYQSSGVTSVLITASPALTVVLAHFTLADERLTPRKTAGVLLALAGALVLTLRGETGLPDVGRANPIGYGLVLIAMICVAATTVYARRHMRSFDSVQVAGIRIWTAALVVMPLSLLLIGLDLSRVNAQGYLALLYASVLGTFVAMLLAFHNIKHYGATASAMADYIAPIVATAAGLWLLDERVTTGMVVGMALIIAGVALLNQRATGRPAPLA